LESTLYVGSSSLVKIAISLLIIAYGHKNTPLAIDDPEHDANYLCTEFKKLDHVRFESLLDNEATLARIEETVTSLWNESPERSQLLLLLTGHGQNNAMSLREDEIVDESHLNRLFQKLHQDSPKELRVTIVFDICRDNPTKQAVKMDRRVALVWSCSLGQKAYALKFNAFPMPRSFFLFGLFMASCDVRGDSRQDPGSFEEHLKKRVGEFAKLNSHVAHVQDCKTCIPGRNLCDNAFEMNADLSQDVDLEQSREGLEGLSSLLRRYIHFTEISERLSTFMLNNKPFRLSNGLSPQEHLDRGASRPTSQSQRTR